MRVDGAAELAPISFLCTLPHNLTSFVVSARTTLSDSSCCVFTDHLQGARTPPPRPPATAAMPKSKRDKKGKEMWIMAA